LPDPEGTGFEKWLANVPASRGSDISLCFLGGIAAAVKTLIRVGAFVQPIYISKGKIVEKFQVASSSQDEAHPPC